MRTIRRSKRNYPLKFILPVMIVIAIASVFLERPSEPATSSQVLIKMLDMPPAFQPNVVTIKAGQTIEWQNVGNEVHHATSDPSLAIKAAEVANPPGAPPFDSGFLRPGETFTHTFTVPGTYRYACVVHEAKGMVGEIIVTK